MIPYRTYRSTHTGEERRQGDPNGPDRFRSFPFLQMEMNTTSLADQMEMNTTSLADQMEMNTTSLADQMEMNTTSLADATLTISSTPLLCTLILYFSVNLPLNCYVLFLLLSRDGGVDMSMVFTLNIAIAEVFLAVLAFLRALSLVYISPLFTVSLDVACAGSMSARFLFQCCVCVERYLAVVHPVTFLRFKPLKYRVACSVLAWISALGVGAVNIYSFAFPPYNAATLMCLVILITELYCCVSVLKDLLRPAPGDKQDGNMSTAKRKAFQVISIYLLALLIQNTPVVCLFALFKALSLEDIYIVQEVTLIVNVLVGFVQPVHVLHKAGKVRFVRCGRA